MQYIIMCGGTYQPFVTEFRPFIKINGERLVDRTIRLLRELGINDIAVSVPLDCNLMDDLDVEVLKIQNDFGFKTEYSTFMGSYADAFYITDEPVCYLMGDVFYSKAALKTIIDKDTDDILFFATHEPFAEGYPKSYCEQLAFKVVNQDHLHQALKQFREYENMGRVNWPFCRSPLLWEIYQLCAGLPVNNIIIESPIFVGVHDFASDVDYDFEIPELERAVKEHCIV